MTLSQELKDGVDGILAQPWSTRDGVKVPETEDVASAGGAVKLEAVILYSDLADSTTLVTYHDKRVAAKVMKSFLYCASRIVTAHGGEIRSFDGDRVMGIYVGTSKNTSAAKAALHINWAMREVIRPKIEAKYPSLAEAGFTLQHATGVDRSDILAVRAGMRGSNDLIWIGRAAAVAAKLSSLRLSDAQSIITSDVYRFLRDEAKTAKDGRAMWVKMSGTRYGLETYKSNWYWASK